MKHKAPQRELGWQEEGFALVQEKGVDYERVAKEQEQREADRKEAEKNQIHMNIAGIHTVR